MSNPAPQPRLTLPLAVIIAGAFIGAGLYFGLRASPRPLHPTEPPAPAAASEHPRTPVPLRPPVDFARAAAELHRPRLLDTCARELGGWSPERRAQVTLDLTFGPDGRQLARGVIEHRDRTPEGLGHCVQSALPPLQIPPPGQAVRVEVALQLP